MKTNYNRALVCGIALLSFAAGSIITARQVRADSGDRVFQLLIYHTLPGKAAALESVFREASKMQAKHGLNVVGYWVPNEDPAWANTFIYMVAHASREDAKKNWDSLHADPAFHPFVKQASEIIDKSTGRFQVDEVYMRPTDFSAMK